MNRLSRHLLIGHPTTGLQSHPLLKAGRRRKAHTLKTHDRLF
jgi:hypothetical protein